MLYIFDFSMRKRILDVLWNINEEASNLRNVVLLDIENLWVDRIFNIEVLRKMDKDCKIQTYKYSRTVRSTSTYSARKIS